jgi:predicted signal transduction protein with EAL and GGDEF domain
MATCAEGVETKEQLAFLRSEGCTEVQGYLYGKPEPATEIIRMLNTGALKAAIGMQSTAKSDHPTGAPCSSPALVPTA